jgi:hypothetical protein
MVRKFPECLVLKQCNIESTEQRRFSIQHPQSLSLRACTVPAGAVIRVANTTEQIIFLHTLYDTPTYVVDFFLRVIRTSFNDNETLWQMTYA